MQAETLKTSFIVSTSHDPWHNIALEETLLQTVGDGEIILYLWQNQHTVVIGRHQNVWKECRWKELEEDGGKLARRLSGGGAVYHDLGNLNFTFVVGKRHYNLHRQLKVLLGAVRAHGIEAEFTGRNDLTVEGQKFSGNAFHSTPRAAFHHGTLLIDVDFAKLGHYLNPPQEKLRSKGVESVQARVVNLKTLAPDMTIDSTIDALKQAFIDEYGGEGSELFENDYTEQIQQRYEFFSSWDWRFGKTPQFDVDHAVRFPWGGFELGLTLKSGMIREAMVYSDALLADLMDRIKEALTGIAYDGAAIHRALDNAVFETEDEPVIADIKEWLGEKGF